MKSVILIILFINFYSITFAEVLCTDPSSAEMSASSISNWEEAYSSYKEYKNCDDGSIAEGYSESISKLLAHKWNEISKLKQIIKTDNSFFMFVLKHIDETTSYQETIYKNSKNLCPEGSEIICNQISEKALSILKN